MTWGTAGDLTMHGVTNIFIFKKHARTKGTLKPFRVSVGYMGLVFKYSNERRGHCRGRFLHQDNQVYGIIELYHQLVRRVMDVVKAWKALPPQVGNRAFALKMAGEVLQQLTIGGPTAPSGTKASASNDSQTPSKSAEGDFFGLIANFFPNFLGLLLFFISSSCGFLAALFHFRVTPCSFTTSEPEKVRKPRLYTTPPVILATA
ncbi:hypothetical protein Sjap_014884 [Stephania japonica]|uniref:Uncharacterized protein n=1 Tax=Stephania japonica TaxID=461633 RepID=A0AAP0IJZ9_9MAGN